MEPPVLPSASSPLSPAPSDASLVLDVGLSLAQYLPKDKKDKTSLILESFLSELPQAGSDNLRQDIKDCNSDQDLHDLATHLVFHILTPRMFSPTSTYTAT